MQAAPPVAAPMVVSTVQTPRSVEHYMTNKVLVLSKTAIVIGALCILFQFVLIGLQTPIFFVAQGIWAGILFVLSGWFGIKSTKMKTTGSIVTFLALAITSAVFTAGIIIASSMDIVLVLYGFCSACSHTGMWAALVINALMLVLGVAEAVVAIVSSALGCHAICGGDQNQTVVVAGQVQYVQGPDGQQQMVILPLDQQAAGLAAGPSPCPAQTRVPPYDQESPPPKYESETKLPIPE